MLEMMKLKHKWRLPRTITLTDITRQKSSLRASASRLTDAGRKSYLFSENKAKKKRV